jgi:cysteine desulfurase/selenocysteine lyase
MYMSTSRSPRDSSLNVNAVRADFPLLNSPGWDRDLHYLDSAATSQKPECVIDAISDCYRRHYGPIHRGLYPLADDASARYEQARSKLAAFVGAPAAGRLIFTRSATESINMVAWGWLQDRLRPGDEVWVSRMEHHANFLPWQRICRKAGARLRIIELKPDATLDLVSASELYGPRTRLIALSHVSNVLGVVNPVKEVAARAAAEKIPVLIDGAQSVGHMPVDVAELGCDFLAFSAHKMCGPSGIGALYAKPERLEEMEPLLLGGGMVDYVGEVDSAWAPYPSKFEAGSPNLAGAVGFSTAVEYLDRLGLEVIDQHVRELTRQALDALTKVPGIRIYGPTETDHRSGIVAFNINGIHPHDLGQIAGEQGVAIRAGHHCCQPLMAKLGTPATARASFALYNGPDDIEALLAALAAARRTFL